MKTRSSIIITLLALLIFGSASAQIDPKEQPATRVYLDSMEAVFLPRVSVKEYLEILKVSDDTTKKKRHMLQTVGIVNAQEWMSKRDVKLLMTLLRSEAKSNCLVMSTSAYLPKGEYTTLGAQVMHMLDAYRWDREYPHFLHKCPVYSEMRVQEIEAWWEVYGKKIKARKIKLNEDDSAEKK